MNYVVIPCCILLISPGDSRSCMGKRVDTFGTRLFCTVPWGSYQLANYTRRSFRGIPAVRMVGEVEPIGGHAIVRLSKKAQEN